MKHSKTPWSLHTISCGEQHVHASDGFCIGKFDPAIYPQDHANRLVMAAGGDLLEACMSAHAKLRAYGLSDADEVIAKLYKAINKATGEL